MRRVLRGRRPPTRAQPLDEQRELLAQQAPTKHRGLALQWRHLPPKEEMATEECYPWKPAYFSNETWCKLPDDIRKCYGNVDKDRSIKERKASSEPAKRSPPHPHHVQPRRHVHHAPATSGSPGRAAPCWHHCPQASGQGKLVQLVAQAIHESPIKALRVRHVYEALKKRYPYFMFMDKKELTTWEGSESRPSSRLSSSSQSLFVHTPLPSFIGSPGRQLGHMEPQLHPLVEWELKTERFATPPSPSIYLNTEQERKPKPVYS
ncbi:uncharacterized protein LOC144112684 isoform X2 [Amblyomma americanum]